MTSAKSERQKKRNQKSRSSPQPETKIPKAKRWIYWPSSLHVFCIPNPSKVMIAISHCCREVLLQSNKHTHTTTAHSCVQTEPWGRSATTRKCNWLPRKHSLQLHSREFQIEDLWWRSRSDTVMFIECLDFNQIENCLSMSYYMFHQVPTWMCFWRKNTLDLSKQLSHSLQAQSLVASNQTCVKLGKHETW